jgi:ABC-type polysaccharide/polyol phosphate transport system ATPase subunit
MEESLAIDIRNLSKTFYVRDKKQWSIRARVRNLFSAQGGVQAIPALKDINLQVKKGEVLGIIGHNGSGKSTLLRLITQSINPNPGSFLKTSGKVMRLALGMGLDQDLSARDNIYLNGSILGLTFKKIGQRFDDIIAFAELEDFVDTPIRFYSNGMRNSLAFSIGLQAEADILLFDEFFGGVGDEAFLKKSADAFDRFIERGKTIVIVSHNKSGVEAKCNRVIELSEGQIIEERSKF